MKISTRSKYGIIAMIDIALSSKENKCISIRSIAKNRGLSEGYLEQLMSSLKKDNYIKSIRGAQGGYTLNKNPKDITIGDLLKTLEGSLCIVECTENDENFKKCGNLDCSSCNAKNAWYFISEKFSEATNSITLYDLINI